MIAYPRTAEIDNVEFLTLDFRFLSGVVVVVGGGGLTSSGSVFIKLVPPVDTGVSRVITVSAGVGVFVESSALDFNIGAGDFFGLVLSEIVTGTLTSI